MHRNIAKQALFYESMAMTKLQTRLLQQQLARWWSGLLFVTLLICLGISTRYYAVADLDSSAVALLFRGIMLIAHFVALCAVLLSPVLAIAMLWPRPRYIIAIGSTWACLIVLALLVDTQVYQLYRFHINAGVLNLLLGGAARETFIFSSAMYAEAFAIALVFVFAVIAISVLLWRSIIRARPRRRRIGVMAGLLLVCVAGFHLGHVWADAIAYEPVLEQTAVLPFRYAATAKRFLRARGLEVRQRQALSASPRTESTALSYPLDPMDCSGPAQPTNIVFIVIDSWRFDEMNARVAPQITAFARNASRFLDHHSGGNATRIGVFSLFYSIPGTYWHQMLTEQRGPVFIDELQRLGYDIQAFRSAPIYSPEFDRTVFADVSLSRVRSQGAGPADWDRDLTNDFLAYLDARNGSAAPFFAFLFYDSPHSFEVPPEYPRVFLPSADHVNYFQLHARADPTPLRNLYRNSVHYVDSLVGKVLDRMRKGGLLESTLVVITGDHGQEFNDTGGNFWGHGSAFSRYQTGVPMLLYVPGQQAAVVRHRTTHFDVAPTLLREHLGCTSALETFSVGRSLFDPAERHPLVLSEYADFAIVERDRITVVRKHGMQTFTPDYAKLESPLDSGATRSALEQKARFYRSVPDRSLPRSEHTRSTSSVE
jgi:membrane-anchored protein YejM (alkaline phosphatase superfamily)